MKLLSALVLLAGAALGYIAWTAEGPTFVTPDERTGVPSLLPRTQPEGTLRQVFEVEGMCTCNDCPRKLYRALVEVDGVEHVAIDPATGLAEVFALEDADLEEMVAALTFEEYVARVIGE